MTTNQILTKIKSLEEELLKLKLSLVGKGKDTKSVLSVPYTDDTIVKNVRKTRKQLWNRKYAQGI